jgi:hypothetical protein
MEIIDNIWFTSKKVIGIVLVKDPYEGYKSYIGVGDGYNELDDIKHITEWGNKFPLEAAKKLFPHIKFEKK